MLQKKIQTQEHNYNNNNNNNVFCLYQTDNKGKRLYAWGINWIIKNPKKIAQAIFDYICPQGIQSPK